MQKALLITGDHSNFAKCFLIVSLLVIFTICLFDSAVAENVNNDVLSPLKQFDSGIAAKDVKCTDSLALLIKSEDSSPACVKLQTAFKLVERSWGSLVILSTEKKNIANTQFSANYTISNAKIVDMTSDTSSFDVIITMQTSSDGYLVISLPQELFKDPRNYSHYRGLIVISDGRENAYKVIKPTPTEITLLIPFVNGTRNIEIVGIYY